MTLSLTGNMGNSDVSKQTLGEVILAALTDILTLANISAFIKAGVSYNAGAFEKLTVSNDIKILTAEKYGSNTKAFITVESNNIRFTVDGTDPTSTDGHLVYKGSSIELNSAADIASFKAIRESADAIIQVTYSD